MFHRKKKQQGRRPSPMLATRHSEELFYNAGYTRSVLRSR